MLSETTVPFLCDFETVWEHPGPAGAREPCCACSQNTRVHVAQQLPSQFWGHATLGNVDEHVTLQGGRQGREQGSNHCPSLAKARVTRVHASTATAVWCVLHNTATWFRLRITTSVLSTHCTHHTINSELSGASKRDALFFEGFDHIAAHMLLHRCGALQVEL